MSRVLCSRSIVKVLKQQVVLSDGDNLVLRSCSGNVENLDSNNAMNLSYFGDIYDTLKRYLIRTENTEMV